MLNLNASIRYALVGVALSSAFAGRQANAQFTTVINVPPDVAPSLIGADTQLNLFEGGSISSLHIGIPTGDNVEVNVHGGSVGDFITASSGSLVNILGGAVGNNFDAQAGSELVVTGGTTGDSFNVSGVANISGGMFGDRFLARTNSLVTIAGGSFGDLFKASIGSVVNVSGGSFGERFTGFGAMKFSGSDFRLDGEPIAGLLLPGDSLPFDLPQNSVLSATLSDGTPFAICDLDGDSTVFGAMTLEVVRLSPPTTLDITTPGDLVPLGIRVGQTLTVDDGGSVNDNFNAGLDSKLIVNGGHVGDNLEVAGGQVTITGGSVGDYFDAFPGSRIDILGGSIGHAFQAIGSVVNVSGGNFNGYIEAWNGSNLNISDGTFGDYFWVWDDSLANISGGVFEDHFNAQTGSEVKISGGELNGDIAVQSGSKVMLSGGIMSGHFMASDGSEVNLQVTELKLNGDLIELFPGETIVIADRGGTLLEATLANGSFLDFQLNDSFDAEQDFFGSGAILTATLVPEPSAVMLLLFAAGFALNGWSIRTRVRRSCSARRAI